MSRVSRVGKVPAALGGERVDRVAAELFSEYSRALLSRWIQEGALTVDGVLVKPKLRLVGGETLRLNADLVPRENWVAADDMVFPIAYQDDTVLVVDKPAGIVVHPGAGNPRGTLVNGLIARFPELAGLPRAGIVHRLDKDTAGLLVVARTLEAHHVLVKMMARREIGRRYLAVVEGRLGTPMVLDQPIGRDPVRRTRQAVRPDGRPALTRVRPLERFRTHTLVEAELETGRTHQIRVHLSAAGFPLVGDRRYGARVRVPPRASSDTVAALRGFDRQALQAWKLRFRHPLNGRELSLATDMAGDLAALVDTLRRDAAESGNLDD